MKVLLIIGGIAQLCVAGFIAFGGYEPSTLSQVLAYLGASIWLITYDL